MRHFYLYRITNIVNGKIYIGIHQTDNLLDGYMGSGKLLNYAIEKYGLANFKKEILETFETEDAMVRREIEVVTEEFCAREDVYNIMPGGKFGSASRNGLSFKGRTHTEEYRSQISERLTGGRASDSTKAKLSMNNFARNDPQAHKEHVRNINQGKNKSESHKARLSDVNTGSRFMIDLDGKRRYVRKVDQPSRLELGWHFMTKE